MRKLFFIAFTLLVNFFILAFSVSVTAEEKNKLLITGSSTVAPLVAEMAQRYESLHSDIKIDVQTGGSSRGISDAFRGIVSMGMVSRDLKPKEKELHVTTIARDGIAIIIHADNPTKVLKFDDVKGIYTGDIKNWKGLGGEDRSIVVVNKAAGRSTLELFLHYLKLKLKQVKADIIIGDNQQGIKTVSGNPNAIGYVSIGAALQAIKEGVKIKTLPMEGVKATLKSVETGRFPLARPLNVVTKEKPTGKVRDFLDFMLKPEQADLIRSLNFVPVGK
ncbi:MAG: phosphate ABC transporter substrate-binding protein [Cocleimonas sp.]|nr:phosphate ABC transporter substrate-binding protein [Cocleimonas sp.]